MDTATLRIELKVHQDDVPAFKGADLMVMPHAASERFGLIEALAMLEAFFQDNGTPETVAAFELIGELFTRAKVTGSWKGDA